MTDETALAVGTSYGLMAIDYAILSALAEKGLIDPSTVADRARGIADAILSSGGLSDGLKEAMAVHLKAFDELVRTDAVDHLSRKPE